MFYYGTVTFPFFFFNFFMIANDQLSRWREMWRDGWPQTHTHTHMHIYTVRDEQRYINLNAANLPSVTQQRA